MNIEKIIKEIQKQQHEEEEKWLLIIINIIKVSRDYPNIPIIKVINETLEKYNIFNWEVKEGDENFQIINIKKS